MADQENDSSQPITQADAGDIQEEGVLEQYYVPLEDRAVISVSGPDARKFLQNLLTNNVYNVTAERAVYAALLTPQGKFLYDFFICEMNGGLLLDCAAEKIEEIIDKLQMYKLHAAATIDDVSEEYAIAALIGEGTVESIDPQGKPGAVRVIPTGVFYIDPRTPAMQVRAICQKGSIPDLLKNAGFQEAGREEYEYLRIWVGLPDAIRDMGSNEVFPLEYGFGEMGAIDFEKGCYIGQEVTARVKYRGNARKKLFPVKVEGPLPEDGTEITMGDKTIGTFCSGINDIGLTLLSVEDAEASQQKRIWMRAGEARLKVDEGTA